MEGLVTYSELAVGDIFEFEGYHYLKVEDENGDYRAVNLNRGTVEDLGNGTKVEETGLDISELWD